MRVGIVWNGTAVERDVAAQTTLQQLLHDALDDVSVKEGCGEGVCGSCTVMLDGAPVSSCIKLALQASGRRVTTAAGLAGDPTSELLIEHLVAREAFQCGYCAPGILVSAVHALRAGRALTPDEVRRALSGNICRCSGYEQMVEAIVAASAGEAPPNVQPRPDLREKIAGAARYPSDISVEGALIGRIAWSERRSARIRSIDTAAARAVPGVVAVLTAYDVPGSNRTGMELFASDHPLLCVERVRSLGDAVAVVAAESAAAAREAVAKLRVDYAPLSEEADQVCSQFVKTRGDLAGGFNEAEVVVEGEYEMTGGDHACMEREGGVGWMDGDTLVLAVTTLTPHLVRTTVARALALPESRVRIETPRMGGSFGKYLMPGIEAYLALLVHATGRRVRLVLDRGESLLHSTKRHPFVGRYKLGLKRDGTFTALEADILADAGPYVGLTPTVVAVFADEAEGAYEFPHMRIRARGVLTNNLLATAMRGFGSQQVTFGIESIVEKAARTLGLDPAEVRRRNFCRTRGDGTGRREEDPANPLPHTLDAVLARLGPRPAARDGWLVGRGLGSIKAKYGYPYGLNDGTMVRLAAVGDGELTVEADVADSGTGLVAALPRIVARRLGLAKPPRYVTSKALIDDPTGTLLTRGVRPSLPRRLVFRFLEKLTVMPTAFALAIAAKLAPRLLAVLLRLAARPVGMYNNAVGKVKSLLFPAGVDSFLPRTSASRGLVMAGRAAVDAADRLGDGQTSIGRATIVQGSLFDVRTGNQVGPVDHMFATHGCDIEVHRETGEVRILRYVACQDVGRVLDPETVRGQIIGGVAMGVSQTLYERMDAGVDSFHKYHLVTSLDAPHGIEIVNLESGRGFGPEGSKGVGEAGCVAAPPALANALYDALGVQMMRVVATREAIAGEVSRS